MHPAVESYPNIVEHSPGLEQCQVLKRSRDSNGGEAMRRQSSDVMPVEVDGAGGRLDYAA